MSTAKWQGKMSDLEDRLREVAEALQFHELLEMFGSKLTVAPPQTSSGFLVDEIVAGRFADKSRAPAKALDFQSVYVNIWIMIQLGKTKSEKGFTDGQFPTPDSFDRYLKEAAKKHSYKRFRKGKNGMKAMAHIQATARLEDMPADVPLEQEDFIHIALRPCLDRLEARQRRIVDAKYFIPVDNADVCLQEGITEDNRRAILSRAYKALLECLSSKGVQVEDLAVFTQ